jgi:hypothetical protein
MSGKLAKVTVFVSTKETPIRGMTCACCGDWCRGRQWHNRDTGRGVCPTCAERIKDKEGKDYMAECFGAEGHNYNVKDG